jgi:hypothetical protein
MGAWIKMQGVQENGPGRRVHTVGKRLPSRCRQKPSIYSRLSCKYLSCRCQNTPAENHGVPGSSPGPATSIF